jgi:hypothetical protein
MKRAAGVRCVWFGHLTGGKATSPNVLIYQFLCVCVLGMLSGSPLPASASRFTFDFQADRVGQRPQGFYFDETRGGAEGKWRVVQDGENQVLAQVDRARDKQRFALAVVKDCKLKDVKLAVKIKSVAGEQEATGGVVWRYRNSENYLVARVDILDKRVRLYRVVNGNLATFGREDGLKLKPDTWYTLRVEHKGNTVKVYLDDEVLIVEKDRHFRDAGKVGLWTKADAKTYFDDFRLRNSDDDD